MSPDAEHEVHGYVLVDGKVYPRCRFCLEGFDERTGKTFRATHLAKKAA